MSVLKRKRELLKLAQEICPEAEVDGTKSAHICITIHGKNKSVRVFCSGTTSDHRSTKNIKRNLLSAAREVGLTTGGVAPK